MPRPPRAVLSAIGFVSVLIVVTAAAGCLEPRFLQHRLHTAVEIDAPAGRVWNVLTDLDAYPSWNPFIRRLQGELRAGERIEVTVQPAGRSEMHFAPTVVVFEPNRELRWLGHLGVTGLFDGEHRLAVEALGVNRTRFVHGEVMSGVLVPFLGGMLRDTERAFEAMNRALKARAEERVELDPAVQARP